MQKVFALSFIASFAFLAALAISAQCLLADPSSAPSQKGSELSPLKIDGNFLLANGKPIRLRGIDWGWWHLMGTRYSEADMKKAAEWGANVVRLSFSYNDLETDDNPAVWRDEGFKDLDEVAQWGKRYGVYVILDMHVVPGGQSTAPYVIKGQNLLWTDAASQERFVALWKGIARRYRDRPEIAAYELVNEPGSGQKTSDLLHSIDQRKDFTLPQLFSCLVLREYQKKSIAASRRCWLIART